MLWIDFHAIAIRGVGRLWIEEELSKFRKVRPLGWGLGVGVGDRVSAPAGNNTGNGMRSAECPLVVRVCSDVIVRVQVNGDDVRQATTTDETVSTDMRLIVVQVLSSPAGEPPWWTPTPTACRRWRWPRRRRRRTTVPWMTTTKKKSTSPTNSTTTHRASRTPSTTVCKHAHLCSSNS